MDEKIVAIRRNGTWEHTTLSEGQKSIEVKWVYKTKAKEGEVEKYNKIGQRDTNSNMKLTMKRSSGSSKH